MGYLYSGGLGGRGDRKKPRNKRREQESEHPFPSILGKKHNHFFQTPFLFSFLFQTISQCTIFLIFSVHATIKAILVSPVIFCDVGRRK